MIKIFLILLVSLFSTTLFAAERGFVEAQFVYDRTNPDQDHQVIEWNDVEKVATITLFLRLTNFDPNWHEGGFQIGLARKAYVTEPEPTGDCKVISFDGVIVKKEHIKPSYIRYQLKGPDCNRDLDMYRLFGMSVSFYEVPSLDNKHHTHTLRVYVVDAPDSK